jgi:hypothetical protein
MYLIAITEISVDGIGWRRFEKKGFFKKTGVEHIGLIRWEEIQTASVFKRDLFGYDLICLELVLSTEEVYELDEEDPHWKALKSNRRSPGSAGEAPKV